MPLVIVIFLLILLPVAYFLWFRPWQLHWGATDDEIVRPMPGDGLVIEPSFNATRGVTVHAPAEAIYPWIIQIGMNRAGWYSYDLLDNLARPSAKRLLPEHQQIYPGQLIPMSPDGKQGMLVREFQANDWILWVDQEGGTSWSWGIYPAGEGCSRLITRVRARYRWHLPAAFFNLLVEFCDIIMMRKCMLGIKRRAEIAWDTQKVASDEIHALQGERP